MMVVVHLNACVYYFVSSQVGIGMDRWAYPGKAGWRVIEAEHEGGHGGGHGGEHGAAHSAGHGHGNGSDHDYADYGENITDILLLHDTSGHGGDPASGHGANAASGHAAVSSHPAEASHDSPAGSPAGSHVNQQPHDTGQAHSGGQGSHDPPASSEHTTQSAPHGHAKRSLADLPLYGSRFASDFRAEWAEEGPNFPSDIFREKRDVLARNEMDIDLVGLTNGTTRAHVTVTVNGPNDFGAVDLALAGSVSRLVIGNISSTEAPEPGLGSSTVSVPVENTLSATVENPLERKFREFVDSVQAPVEIQLPAMPSAETLSTIPWFTIKKLDRDADVSFGDHWAQMDEIGRPLTPLSRDTRSPPETHSPAAEPTSVSGTPDGHGTEVSQKGTESSSRAPSSALGDVTNPSGTEAVVHEVDELGRSLSNSPEGSHNSAQTEANDSSNGHADIASHITSSHVELSRGDGHGESSRGGALAEGSHVAAHAEVDGHSGSTVAATHGDSTGHGNPAHVELANENLHGESGHGGAPEGSSHDSAQGDASWPGSHAASTGHETAGGDPHGASAHEASSEQSHGASAHGESGGHGSSQGGHGDSAHGIASHGEGEGHGGHDGEGHGEDHGNGTHGEGGHGGGHGAGGHGEEHPFIEVGYKKPIELSSRFVNDTLLQKYSYCMYWSVKMMTSKPYELANPTTTLQFIVHIFDALFGIFMFANIVGEVDGIIERINKASDDFKEKLDSVKQYISMRKVGREMESRVVKWFDYVWANNGSLDEDSVLSVLPEYLRMEIAKHVHLDVLKKVPIFQGIDEQFLLELAEKLRFEAFCPGDYVCRKGDIGREIYVVRRGLLNVIAADGVKVIVTLKSGVVFGELSLLNVPGSANGNRRTVTVRTVGYADLFSLSKEAFWTCLEEYPEVKEQLMEKARKILQKDNLFNEEAAREAARRGRNFAEVAGRLEENLEIISKRLTRFWQEQIEINQSLLSKLEKLENAKKQQRKSQATAPPPEIGDLLDLSQAVEPSGSNS